MKTNLKKIFIGVFITMWQSASLVADMGPIVMSSNQETVMPATAPESSTQTDTAQTSGQSASQGIPPAASLGGTEMTLTPASTSGRTAGATSSDTAASSADSTKSLGADASNPTSSKPAETNTPTMAPEPGVKGRGDLDPNERNTINNILKEPEIIDLANLPYIADPPDGKCPGFDCDDAAELFHDWCVKNAVECEQIKITWKEPSSDPNLPSEGHAHAMVLVQVSEYTWCLVEPQERNKVISCYTNESPEMTEEQKAQMANELSKVWIDRYHPDYTIRYPACTYDEAGNIDPSCPSITTLPIDEVKANYPQCIYDYLKGTYECKNVTP